MKSNSKNLYWIGGIVIVLAIILIAIFTGNSNTVSGKETVKIGISMPLTGDLATYGQGDVNAIRLALEEFGNDTKYDYQLIIEDDGYDSSTIATNVQKFVSVDNVDAIMTLGSLGANVAAPIAEENNVLNFASSASDLTVADGKFGFDQTTTPQAEAEKMTEELQARDISKISVVVLNTEAFQSMYLALEGYLEGTGIEIVHTETFNSGETNFKTGILKLEESNSEIYVVLMYSPEIELFKKQADEQGVVTPMTSIESFSLTEEKNLFEGLWYIGSGSETEGYINAYQTAYGSYPASFSNDAYTNMKLIISVYESTDKKLSPEEMVPKFLAVKNFEGASGIVSSDEDGIFSSPATVRKIVNGEEVIL